MKKKLYLALLVTLTTAFVLTGCSGCNTETVEETTENTTSEEVMEEDITSEVEETTETEENSVSEESTEDAITEEVEFEPYKAVINYTANLRSGPGTDYEKVGLIVEGTEVTVLEELGEWCKISYEEAEVYIMSQYLDKAENEETESVTEEVEENAESETEVKEEAPAYTVTDMEKTMYAQRSVNVRSGPATNYEKLGALNTNDEVKVTGQADNGWYRIEYKGNEGFVSNNYLGDSKVVVNTTPATPENNGTTENTTPTAPTTPTVDTSNVATRTVNGSTRYAFRTTANGTPIYDGIDWQWPQYIVDVINECCTPSMSDYEKAVAIYNWMTANISYNGNNYYYTTRDTLTYRNAVCNGYANTYQSLCCAAGITSSVVIGYSLATTTGHAWNFVYIDGVKYFTDTSNGKPLNNNISIYTNENNDTVVEYTNTGGSNGKLGMKDEYWNGYLDAL